MRPSGPSASELTSNSTCAALLHYRYGLNSDLEALTERSSALVARKYLATDVVPTGHERMHCNNKGFACIV